MTRVMTVPPGMELKDDDGRPVARATVNGCRVKRTRADGGRVRVLVDQGADVVGLWVVFDTEAAYVAAVSHGLAGE